jgi:hypothetical protein
LRRFILASAGLLACCCFSIGGGASQATAAITKAKAVDQRQAAIRWLGSQIVGYQKATWHWQRLMGIPLTATQGRMLVEMSIPDVERAARLWHRLAAEARQRAQNPPHKAAFLCIHRFEGSWPSNTGNGYYGGLQMNLGFQQTYAPWLLRTKGTADHWTPLEQMWTAEKAAKSRGFYPWPNTARFCGLI